MAVDADACSLFDDLTEYVAEQRQAVLLLAWDGMYRANHRNAAFRQALRELRVAGLGEAPVVAELWHVRGAVAGVSVKLSSAGTLEQEVAIETIRAAAAAAGVIPCPLYTPAAADETDGGSFGVRRML